ncbi:hypothetical protein [Blastococcus sp. SYSU DS0539]
MTQPRPSGATAAGEKSRLLWPWLLLAALITGALGWWLVAALAGGGNRDGGAVPGTSTAPPAAPPGAVLVGDLDALAPDVDLSGHVGEPVEGDAVEVREVVADEAFYVGPEAGRTILVRLQTVAAADATGSPFEVEAGDTVSFTGTLEQVDDRLLSELRLHDAAAQREAGDFYVRVEDITRTR